MHKAAEKLVQARARRRGDCKGWNGTCAGVLALEVAGDDAALGNAEHAAARGRGRMHQPSLLAVLERRIVPSRLPHQQCTLHY